VFRIPRWLFVLLVPLLFLGGCVSSLRPAWSLIERRWIRPVQEPDKPHFPVLVRGSDGIFAPATLGHMPPESVVVTSGLDEPAINRDLNARIDSKGDYKFFQVLERTSDVTRVTLEVPTMKDSKLQSWYDIRGSEVLPQKIMRYGPGFAFFVIPPTALCGLALVGIFAIFVRPKKRIRDETPKT
jgi:hypothetical protein